MDDKELHNDETIQKLERGKKLAEVTWSKEDFLDQLIKEAQRRKQ